MQEGSAMEETPMSQERLQERLDDLRQRVTRLELEHRQSESLLSSLVESVPDIIYRLDQHGNIVFISDAVKKYGYEPEELIGTSILDLVHPEDRETATYKVNDRRTGDRSTQSLEIRLFTKDHDPVSFEFKASDEPFEPTLAVSAEGIYSSDQPQIEGFVCTQGVARDITDRVKAEQALREAERVRVFTETAGAAAHEINQPLTVVMGTLQMMVADVGSDDPHRKQLERVLEQAEKISEIVKKMLTAHRYVTKPYAQGMEIADFDASVQEDGEEAEER